MTTPETNDLNRVNNHWASDSGPVVLNSDPKYWTYYRDHFKHRPKPKTYASGYGR
jgi:hypothetical protein